MSVSKNNEHATKKAMEAQNKYLTQTTSIPLIGLSFEALMTKIEIGETGQATIESIIYQHCLSIEPTAKTTDLGRFNLICHHDSTAPLLEFIKNDIPVMWTLLPPTIAHKFQEALQVTHPRLTAGYSGIVSSHSGSVILEDPQSVSSPPDKQWMQPPDTRRPPRYVSVIYNTEGTDSEHTSRRTTSDIKSRTSSDKSQTTTQSASDLSTLVSSIREDMNRELQAHTETINALKQEISQLRSTPAPSQSNLATIQAAEHHNIVQSLRQELQELRQSIPSEHPKPSLNDISQLIASVVESMVPLITDAVRQGLAADNDPIKRIRPLGSTPTQFRTSHLQPINLMESFTANSEPPPPTPSRSPSTPSTPITDTTPQASIYNSARQSDGMEE